MNKDFPSRCGINCDKCEYKEKVNCPGCIASKGQMFWGKCKLAACCVEKELQHCGQCSGFPCDKLQEFAYDKENGDDGQRIRNLEQWIAEA